jgi:hypothetical protein
VITNYLAGGETQSVVGMQQKACVQNPICNLWGPVENDSARHPAEKLYLQLIYIEKSL